ncbi:hypothetical protein GW17_00045465 [Ensete ventricosum]|nr:hypothetical protein GW17_00045465 [Ensete ventricosum]
MRQHCVCTQVGSSVGHTVDGPCRALGRLCASDRRIKRRPHAGLLQVTDHSRIKWRSCVAKAMQAMASRTSSSNRIPTVGAGHSRALVAKQAIATLWRPHRRRRRW